MLLFSFRSNNQRTGAHHAKVQPLECASLDGMTAPVKKTSPSKQYTVKKSDSKRNDLISTCNDSARDTKRLSVSSSPSRQPTQSAVTTTSNNRKAETSTIPTSLRQSRIESHQHQLPVQQQQQQQEVPTRKHVTFGTIQIREYSLTAYQGGPRTRKTSPFKTLSAYEIYADTTKSTSKVSNMVWLLSLDWKYSNVQEFPVDDYEWQRYREGRLQAGRLRKIRHPMKRLKKVRGKAFVDQLRLEQPKQSKHVSIFSASSLHSFTIQPEMLL